jgi:hypothetical protein
LTGNVVDISQVAAQQSGDIVYKVRIRLNEADPRLRWGMTMEVSFPEK